MADLELKKPLGQGVARPSLQIPAATHNEKPPRAQTPTTTPQESCLSSSAKQIGVFSNGNVNCRLCGLIQSPPTLNYRGQIIKYSCPDKQASQRKQNRVISHHLRLTLYCDTSQVPVFRIPDHIPAHPPPKPLSLQNAKTGQEKSSGAFGLRGLISWQKVGLTEH